MWLSSCPIRLAGIAIAASALIITVPVCVASQELATAQGTIAIREAPVGQRSPLCSELVVEARNALDNHLIGLTHAEADANGSCRYAISVPAQSAVWLHPRPVLVEAARSGAPDDRAAASASSARILAPSASRERVSASSVQLRFRIVAPETYFFTPGEQKAIGLTY